MNIQIMCIKCKYSRKQQLDSAVKSYQNYCLLSQTTSIIAVNQASQPNRHSGVSLWSLRGRQARP